MWDEARWDEDLWPQRELSRLGIDELGIELFGFGQAVATWGDATWGEGYVWPARAWHAIGCEVTQLRYSWGADRSLGVLTVAAGGAMELSTIDPDSTLDPSNTASPFALDLMPGAYMRVTYQGEPIAIAVLDTIRYSNQDGKGSIGGTDAVGVLSNVKVTVPTNPPATLRALARVLVSLAGLQYVRVEPDPPAGDPAVGVPNEDAIGEVGLWAAISDAAVDALHYAWIGPDLLIHFRSHGDPADKGLTIGLGGVPLLELVAQASADGIVNRVLARGPTGTTYTKNDPDSIARFGAQEIDRSSRRVPDPVTWADYVVADRSWASLEYLPSAIIPTTPAELRALVLMGGLELVRVRTDLTEPPVSVDMRSIGLEVDVSPDGWAVAVLGYVSSVEWRDNMTPPPPATTTPVPNFAGMSLTAATAAALALPLVLTSTEKPSSALAGTVIAQSPAAGTVVNLKSTVAVTIAALATVPSLSGKSEAAARSALTSAYLTPGAKSTAVSSSVGLVVGQSPAAGSRVAVSSAVAYTVGVADPLRTVPALAGKTESAARSAISAAGLTAGAKSTATSSSVGLVVGQSPASGARVAAGSAVAFTVGVAAPPVTTATVPAVVGDTLAQATSEIQAAGLVVASAQVDSSSTAGTIIAQSPAAGATVERNSTVSVSVARTPTTAAVPSVVGDTLAQATSEIQAAGLVVASAQVDSSSTAGTIIAQSPAAGATVARGSTVSVSVARVATTTVPSIIGSTESAALSSLSSSRLVAGARSTATAAAAAGTVIAQSPAAGSSVAVSSAVAYTASLGPVRVTRTTTSSKVARVAQTSSGANYGAGAETASPAGAYQGWRNRVLVGLTADFSGAIGVVSATLRLRTSTQDNVAFGSNPKVRVQRITAAWSEGSATAPGSSNAVVYPGPAATGSGESVKSITRSENATVDIDVTAIVRAWAPPAAGGSGAVNHGVRIIGYSESDAGNTTEFETDDNGTASKRPQLIIVLDTL